MIFMEVISMAYRFQTVLASCLLLLSSSITLAQGNHEDLLELIDISSSDPDVIRIPIRFHLVQGATMEKKGVSMNMWISEMNVRDEIITEINRIWRPARITWVIESIREVHVPDTPNFVNHLKDITQSNRETPGRTKMIMKVIKTSHHHPVIHNLYFFPYIGETLQGFASFGGRLSIPDNPDGGTMCVVCAWTDKPSGARKPPHKFDLCEPLPFERGSVSRTCSHELGHNLLLQHPDKETQTITKRLMGGKQKGYGLTPDEVALARSVAYNRISTIKTWIAAHQ